MGDTRGLDTRFALLDQPAGHWLAPMAAGAVIYNFAVQLADVDRGVRDLTGRLTTWIEVGAPSR